MKLVLASTEDVAAQNIAARLRELYNFKRVEDRPDMYVCKNVMLAMVPGGITQLTSLPLTADEVIVASRHVSESGRPTLTTHAPGEPEKLKLAVASPPAIKSALLALARMRDELNLPYEVSLEATHHGPTQLDVPVTFVEIGSSPEQWRDERAGKAVAQAIMTAAISPIGCRQAIGLGGPHYAPRHTEITLHTDVGVGHILPKYANINEKLVERAIARTRGDIELLALDWKGMSGEQRQISQRVASKLGIQTRRAQEILSYTKI